MNRPVLLDAFCGAGGAAMGYYRAGFDVYGVDSRPQRNYPFPFRQGDAVALIASDGYRFHAIHASPPCQAYSVTKSSTLAKGIMHPALLEPTRDALRLAGRPYVIENVVGAPLIDPITLCGASFDLTATDTDGVSLVLKRHRLFESSITLDDNGGCRCAEYRRKGYQVGGVYGGGSERRVFASRSGQRGGYSPTAPVRRVLMGIDWTSSAQLSQAIPPAYTEHIGRQLMGAL